jgi:hypothetical protein
MTDHAFTRCPSSVACHLCAESQLPLQGAHERGQTDLPLAL